MRSTATDRWGPPAPDADTLHLTVMGGPAQIHLAGSSRQVRQAAAAAAAAEVRRIEARYSRYRADSLVSRINAAAGSGEPVAVDEETAALLDFATRLHEASQGRFDITSGVLRQAWNFDTPRRPDPAVLDAVRARIGWSRVHWDGHCIALPKPGMEIDFGGFGKEYAADRAAGVAAAHGIAHGFVNLAGDLRLLGPQPDGEPWRLGIRDPRDDRRTVASVSMTHGALATSGDYERGFDLDGRRFHHILDATTGWPAEGWRAVSVTAPVCAAAGALATLAMLAGPDALEMLRAEDVGWLAVDDQGRVQHAAGPRDAHWRDA